MKIVQLYDKITTQTNKYCNHVTEFRKRGLLQYLLVKLSLYTLQPYNIDPLRIAGNASNIDLLCGQYVLKRAHNYRLFVKISLHEILIRYVSIFIVFSSKIVCNFVLVKKDMNLLCSFCKSDRRACSSALTIRAEWRSERVR